MKKEIDLFAQLKADRAKLHTSTLANQEYVNVPKRSAGLTPMDQVATQGSASQGMVSGRMPWWVLITGWFGVGLYVVIAVSIVFSGPLPQSVLFNPGFWILLLILIMYIAIMWRGTSKKISGRKLR